MENPSPVINQECFRKIGSILRAARVLAIDYYKLTQKPLGITGEIGEYEAARLLGLKLTPAREPGFDAVDRAGRKVQIKTRRIESSNRKSGQRLGRIKLDQPWDIVVLVILNEAFEPVSIYESLRSEISATLLRPGSKSRNERGALSVSSFRSIGRQVWPR